MNGHEPYIATTVQPGYARYAIRLGAALLCVIDLPAWRRGEATGLAHKWLAGEPVPEDVTVWPASR